MSLVELTILMPCLNEAATLGTCIAKAQAAIARDHLNAEIVVADNGSSDGSQEIARKLGARVVDIPTKGYGAALLGGIAAAKGEYILMADADDSYDLGNPLPFLEKLREGYDLVMGNRFQGKILPGAMPSLHRYFGTPFLTLLTKIFYKTPIGDVQCGIRGLRKEAIERVGLRSLGMEFASEMVWKSTVYGLRIAEIPTTLAPDGRGRPPHMRSWRDGWRNLRFMLLFSPRWLFLYPGLGLMLLGLTVGIWLLPGPRYIGGVGFDVHTLLYAAAMILVGYQSVTFAVFTKLFAIEEGLMPPDRRFLGLFQYITLEVGVIVGALLVGGGLAISVLAVGYWKRHAFGPLDPFKTLRLVTPGVVALTIGFQTIFSSFFLSVLGLKRR